MTGYKIINGTVYEPGSGRFEKKDVYVWKGKLVTGFPKEAEQQKEEQIRVIDAAGCYVTKGLVDYHVHYFEGGADNGVNPDVASFPNGVTTAVDGGTCGASCFEIFKKSIMDRADVELYSQLLVGSSGQLSERYAEQIEAEQIEEEKIVELFENIQENL